MASRPPSPVASDRPPVHPSRGESRAVAVRLKSPDADRLSRAARSRGLSLSDYLRTVIHRDLDALDSSASDVLT